VEATLKAVPLLVKSGCDIIELGIPFSDPLADGVTIQQASFQALQKGVTPKTCLEIAGELRKKVNVPLVFMTYFNPVFSYGTEKFCEDCIKAGMDGLIIPDLPPEESGELETSSQKCGLDLIYLVAPTSPEERLKLVSEKSRGFIYLVSVTGTTGARTDLPEDLERFVARVRRLTASPLCVGFGISTPEQAKRVARAADGIIVGSRIVQLMENDAKMDKLADFAAGLRKALDEL